MKDDNDLPTRIDNYNALSSIAEYRVLQISYE